MMMVNADTDKEDQEDQVMILKSVSRIERGFPINNSILSQGTIRYFF